MLILLLVAILTLPLVARLCRAFLVFQVVAVLLFLPAGLLLRLGPGRNLHVFFGVTAVWGLAVVDYAARRRRARTAAAVG